MERKKLPVRVTSGFEEAQLKFEVRRGEGEKIVINPEYCRGCVLDRVCYGFDMFGETLFRGKPDAKIPDWRLTLPENTAEANCNIKSVIRRMRPESGFRQAQEEMKMEYIRLGEIERRNERWRQTGVLKVVKEVKAEKRRERFWDSKLGRWLKRR
ncbi:MAG TPA: hypothetical protein VF828_03185 [Patescibacteria group bacterium]